ncbi:MAG: PP2C family protein-serine/threonine phosphatase [Acidimicrobiales bacterium]
MGDGKTQSSRLDDILSVTHVGLSRLGVEHLLVELLNRVRDILEADTAAVLMVDPGGTHLVARAACGIEEEVRQGVQVPMGHGFAGTIASRKRPVVLDEVGPATVANPILWEKGIKVMLGVPLMSADKVIGVLHVGRTGNRRFGQGDIDLLSVVGVRVSASIQTHQLAAERSAADLLERSLLPPTLPRCAGIELAARYVTGDDRSVGGDWYDAFTLPSGALWVVIGDVAGHGLAAAVVMGRIRSTLRAYALEDHPPDEVLRLVDRKVRRFEIGTIATVACAVSLPPYEVFDVVTAGHLPPVLVAPDGPAATVDLNVAPPLGAGSPAARAPARVAVPEGGALVLYTDGLIERRGETLDVGLDRLCRAVVADRPEAICGTVMHELVGSQNLDDDVAMIVASRTGG